MGIENEDLTCIAVLHGGSYKATDRLEPVTSDTYTKSKNFTNFAKFSFNHHYNREAASSIFIRGGKTATACPGGTQFEDH
ncbi:hypothetical protein TNCV_1417731 [Trichonephila clavipes]|nr:hypothetical protein TNCV_1417731 [Trichonephila clavipes]